MSTPAFQGITSCLTVALALAATSPAAAQGFLKSLAREAAQRAAVAAVTAGPEAAQAEPSEPAAEDSRPQTSATSAAPSTGPEPWPLNVGAPSVKNPMHLKFSDDLEGRKKAFLEFSKVSCNDCEGGYSYDAWAQHFVRLDGSWKAWEKKLGALAMGETLSWQGSKSKGVITVMDETPVNGWPCKQLRWTLTRADAKAERPGLICNARPDGAPDWTIAF